MNKPIDPQTQTMLDNMPEKTGKPFPEWADILRKASMKKHGEMMKLLKGQYGVTHGYANTISILYRQQVSGETPSADDLVKAQFAGAKAGLKPIYDAVISAASGFGDSLEIAPKKTYVSLRRSKQFAIVQAATRSRVDLGLNLKGVEPTERLEGGNVFSGMCTHRVRLHSPEDVNTEVISWLRQAFDQA